MLGTKLKLSIDFIPIADQYQVFESALSSATSFASHIKLHKITPSMVYKLMIRID